MSTVKHFVDTHGKENGDQAEPLAHQSGNACHKLIVVLLEGVDGGLIEPSILHLLDNLLHLGNIAAEVLHSLITRARDVTAGCTQKQLQISGVSRESQSMAKRAAVHG